MADFRGEMSFPTTLTAEEVEELDSLDWLDYDDDDESRACPECLGVGDLEEVLSSSAVCYGTGYVD